MKVVFLIIQSVLFLLLSGAAFGYFFYQVRRIYLNIRLGKPMPSDDRQGERVMNMLLVAFGQKKMFQNVIPAVLHLFLYIAFVITQIELLEVMIDGIAGQHRFFYHLWKESPFLHGLYVFTIGSIEVLSVLALLATIAFLWRRNMLKLPRFTMPELKGWPTKDANLILLFEVYLVSCIFLMNTADMALHHGEYGFPVSGMLWPLLSGLGETTLVVLERIGWWGHIIGVFAFMNYLPSSKHLHIFLAFPNTYFARLEPAGTMHNMPEITREIRLMMDPQAAVPEASTDPVRFGARDVFDLNQKNLLDAYTCTECGRCSAACPANQTGKLLSPRKIMMDVRDRMEEVGRSIEANSKWEDDGKSLIENGYISVEELRACTTCNACVQECPVQISPLDIILQLRRNLVMEDSNAPNEWAGMFTNIENNGAPWQFAQADRLNWAKQS